MSQHIFDRGIDLRELAQYDTIRGDLIFLRDEVEKEEDVLPSRSRLLRIDPSSIKSLLRSDWVFALVTMPCWVGRALGVSDEIRRRSMVGGYYLCHYGLAIDQLLDANHPGADHTLSEGANGPGNSSDPGKAYSLALDIATTLPLAISLAFKQFHYILDSDSAFWADFQHSCATWADAMYWEREVKSYSDVTLEDAMRTESGKCAPVCIGPVAVCRAGGREELIADVGSAITTTNMAMNLIDDSSDWLIDLTEGRFNSFVALAASGGFLESSIPTFEEMLYAILHTSLLDLYLEQVCTLIAQTEQTITSIGATLWLPLLADLRYQAMQRRDAFRTGLVSISSSLFEEE